MSGLIHQGNEALELIVKRAYRGNFQEWLGSEVTIEAKRISNGVFETDYLYHSNGTLSSEKRHINLEYSGNSLTYKLLNPNDGTASAEHSFTVSKDDYKEIKKQKKLFLSYLPFSEGTNAETPVSLMLSDNRSIALIEYSEEKSGEKTEFIAPKNHYSINQLEELTGIKKVTLYNIISDHKAEFSRIKEHGRTLYHITEENRQYIRLKDGILQEDGVSEITPDSVGNTLLVGRYYTTRELSEFTGKTKGNISVKISTHKGMFSDRRKQGKETSFFITEDNLKIFESSKPKTAEKKTVMRPENHYNISQLATMYRISNPTAYKRINNAVEPLTKLDYGKEKLYHLDDNLKALLEHSSAKVSSKQATQHVKKQRVVKPESDYSGRTNIVSQSKSKGVKQPNNNSLESTLRRLLIFESLDTLPQIDMKGVYTQRFFLDEVLQKPSHTYVARELVKLGLLKTTKVDGKKREALTGLSIMSLLNKYASVKNDSHEKDRSIAADSNQIMLQEFATSKNINPEALFEALMSAGIAPETRKGISYIDKDDAELLMRELGKNRQ